MPLYEYECDNCGKRFELIRKFSESEIEACTLCGKGPVRRLMSSPAIQFKGTGWYITDYAKGKSGSDASSSSSSKTESAKTESSKTDSGSAGTTAAKTDTPAAKPSSDS